jgi:hypothetical protein
MVPLGATPSTPSVVVKRYSDFEMPQLARGIAQAAELQKKLNGVMPQPTPGVVKWRHTFGNDWSGDPAIFFWVTLTDEASKKENLSRNRLKERLGGSPSPQDRQTADTLRFIAGEFVSLRQDRHTADYDNSAVWSYTEVENAITRAHTLYIHWNTVRDTPLAQSYLLDMMGGR